MAGKRYTSPAGYHRHKCGSCGTVWEHADACHNDEAAHHCPDCGVLLEDPMWSHYLGREAPGPAPVKSKESA